MHPSITHHDIADRAYAIWEKCGRIPGHENDHWERAERELYHDAEQAAALHGQSLALQNFDSKVREDFPAGENTSPIDPASPSSN